MIAAAVASVVAALGVAGLVRWIRGADWDMEPGADDWYWSGDDE